MKLTLISCLLVLGVLLLTAVAPAPGGRSRWTVLHPAPPGQKGWEGPLLCAVRYGPIQTVARLMRSYARRK